VKAAHLCVSAALVAGLGFCFAGNSDAHDADTHHAEAKADRIDGLTPTAQWSANMSGMAAVPPMGWNTWNAFYHDIDEEKVMASAQILRDEGLADLGYQYINLDDGWWRRRDMASGRMVIHTDRFPSAETDKAAVTTFKPFTDRIHAMGFKAGIYSDIGRNSCGQIYAPEDSNQPQGSILEREVGLYDHIDQDIALYFGEWGFDYIKVDGCGIRAYGPDAPRVKAGKYRALTPLVDMASVARTDIPAVESLFQEVADAINRHSHDGDHMFSVCLWGSSNVRSWAKNVGNLSRTSDDITPDWTRLLTNFDTTVTRPLYAQPGSWNDPDMLFIGQGDFDADHMMEARSHFSLWAITNAPLLIGYDLRKATPEQLELLGNERVVAVNQDTGGHQAVLAFHSADLQILQKTLSDGRKAVAIFNRGFGPVDASLTSSHLKMKPDSDIVLEDLWMDETLSFQNDTKITVEPRETRLFIATGTRELDGGVYLSEIPGSINVAEDGVLHPTHDPNIHRGVVPWSGTRGPGELPSYAGWGGAQADRSPFNNALRMGGTVYDSGIGILANSRLEVKNQGYSHFTAEVGFDDSASLRDGPLTFSLYGDGQLLAEEIVTGADQSPSVLSANIADAKIIELITTYDGDAGFALPVVWGNARLTR